MNNEIEINVEEESITYEENKDYEQMENKPKINNVELVGNKTSADLGITDTTYTAGTNIQISNENVISATDTVYDDTQIQSAITNLNNNKVDKVLGKGLSTNDYTSEEKTKLSGIESNAEVNVIEDVKVNGTSQTITDKSVNITVPDVSNFITSSVDNLVNYYKKSETYTQTDLATLLNAKQDNITSSNKLSSDLVDDTNSTNKFVTTSEKSTWNNKSDFSGSYNDLTDKPTIPTVPTNVSAFTNDAGYLTQHQDISGKVDKIEGKGLSTNDLTNELLASLQSRQVQVIDTIDNIDVSALDEGVYIINNNNDTINRGLVIRSNHIYAGNKSSLFVIISKLFDNNTRNIWCYGQRVYTDATRIDGTTLSLNTINSNLIICGTIDTNSSYTSLRATSLQTSHLNLKAGTNVTVSATGISVIPPTTPTNNTDLIGKAYFDNQQALKQDTIQYSTMPTADSTTVGKIVQYIGTTDNTYTNGYFYIGTSTTETVEEEEVTTYSWEQINVQPNESGASTLEDLENVFVFNGANMIITTNQYTIRTNDSYNKSIAQKLVDYMLANDYTTNFYCYFGNTNLKYNSDQVKKSFFLNPNQNPSRYSNYWDIRFTDNIDAFIDGAYYTKPSYKGVALKIYFTNDTDYIVSYFELTVSPTATRFINDNTEQYIRAKKTFTVLPESSVTPTTNNQLTNKSYVDTAIANAITTTLESGEF